MPFFEVMNINMEKKNISWYLHIFLWEKKTQEHVLLYPVILNSSKVQYENIKNYFNMNHTEI